MLVPVLMPCDPEESQHSRYQNLGPSLALECLLSCRFPFAEQMVYWSIRSAMEALINPDQK